MIAKTYLHALALSSCLLAAPAFAQGVNLYMTREPALLNPVLEAFTKDTGIKVNAVFLKDCLQERVRAEGANSPAKTSCSWSMSARSTPRSMPASPSRSSPNRRQDRAGPAAPRRQLGQP